jgi:septum formation protein
MGLVSAVAERHVAQSDPSIRKAERGDLENAAAREDRVFAMTKINLLPVILASNSPRRRDLLTQAGLTFLVAPADVDERVLAGEKPEEYALRVAADKARAAAGRTRSGIVIAADTIVVLDDQILGKPVDARDAERMLSLLSGRQHQVMTGLVVCDAATGRTDARVAVSAVWFKRLSPAEISAYVATGEPLDKAGAYGIQERGALLVEKIEGCYFNIVGLPLFLLGQMLRDFGIALL